MLKVIYCLASKKWYITVARCIKKVIYFHLSLPLSSTLGREERWQNKDKLFKNALERSIHPNIEKHNLISNNDDENPLVITIDDIDEFLKMNDSGFMDWNTEENINELHGLQSEPNFQKSPKDNSDPLFPSNYEMEDFPKVRNQKNTLHTNEQNPHSITIDEFLTFNDFGLTNSDFKETSFKKSLKRDPDPLLSSENQGTIVIDDSSENESNDFSKFRNLKNRKRKLYKNQIYQTKRSRVSQNPQNQDDINLNESSQSIKDVFPGYNPYYGYTGMSSLARFNISGITKESDAENEVSLEDYNPDKILVVPDNPQHYKTHLENQEINEENHETFYNEFDPQKLVHFVSHEIPNQLSSFRKE